MLKVPYTRRCRNGKHYLPYIDLVTISQLYRAKLSTIKVSDEIFKKAMTNAFFEILKFAASEQRQIRLPKSLGTVILKEYLSYDADVNLDTGIANIPLNYSEMIKLRDENKPAVVFDLFARYHYKVFYYRCRLSCSLPNYKRYRFKVAHKAFRIRKLLYADRRKDIPDLQAFTIKNPSWTLKEFKK